MLQCGRHLSMPDGLLALITLQYAVVLQCGRHLSMPDGSGERAGNRVAAPRLQCGRHLSMPDGRGREAHRGQLLRASMWPASLDAGWRRSRRSPRLQACSFNVAGISRCRMGLARHSHGHAVGFASMWPASLDAGWDFEPMMPAQTYAASMWPASLDAGWEHMPEGAAQGIRLQCGRHLSMPDGHERPAAMPTRLFSLQCGRHLSMPDGPLRAATPRATPSRFNVAGISRCRMEPFRPHALRPLHAASMWPASLDAGWRQDGRAGRSERGEASMWPASLDAGWGMSLEEIRLRIFLLQRPFRAPPRGGPGLSRVETRKSSEMKGVAMSR